MSERHEIKLMTPTTTLIVALMLAGIATAFYRLTAGLGAATNLNDEFPWGLWLGFDVLGGVAMAAGGFLIAGAVYLLNMKKYKPIVRPAILTAFLGYLLAVIALFLDIGHPFRLWHPAIMWQVHSVMWVVAMHVIFYTTTLAIEFSPMLFEKLKMEKAAAAVERVIMPVVLFGVMLSVLHQSSLGAVFLIIPGKLSAFWYSTKIPYFFLVSAVAMGLSMVSMEAILSARAFGHKMEREILDGLARGVLYTLVVYLLMKVVHILLGPGFGGLFGGSMEASLLLIELVAGVIAPICILAARQEQTKGLSGLVAAHCLVIMGVLLNRLNVCIFGVYADAAKAGGSYFPSTSEFVLTIGMLALGVFAFKLAAKYLDLFPEAKAEARALNL